ncbi:MAG: 1-deoxy-D-xylulose-5-phosphate synthase [Clostridia bacterium]|nr:1-deoxy-D-xylulose-5-phosphate synthase [Clostridia bacterium]
MSVKDFIDAEKTELSTEIRQRIMEVVEKNGGHLASNLGVVELTVALHAVFDFAGQDRVFFDVGHQCYAHKLLTGRDDCFDTLRRFGGISGFPDKSEDCRDSFSAGHSSTSLSAALGLCVARDRAGEKNHIIAVIGDGALTGGEAYEALNHIGETKTRLIIILNDNQMSIDKNVGVLTRNLTKLRVSRGYKNFKRGFSGFLRKIPLIGKGLHRFAEGSRNFFRGLFTRDILFEHFNLKYTGVFDGHDIKGLISVLQSAKQMDRPVLIHINTKKGSGNVAAESFPDRFHGVKSGLAPGESAFSSVAGQALCAMAENNSSIAVVTAAMAEGTGMKYFAAKHPDRLYDVGIAEQHAVTFAAGLCEGGLKPYVAIYSTFLQRAYDQIITDVCMNAMPVVFLVDRAGIVGSDGKTHHGVFDVSYFGSIPNMHVLAPADIQALKKCIAFSETFSKPLSIRYGNFYRSELSVEPPENPFLWQTIGNAQSKVAVITYSNLLLHEALTAQERLKEEGIEVQVINACSISPIDTRLLQNLSSEIVVVLEDSVPSGGLAQRVALWSAENGSPFRLVKMTLPENTFVTHGSYEELLKYYSLDADSVCRAVREAL